MLLRADFDTVRTFVRDGTLAEDEIVSPLGAQTHGRKPERLAGGWAHDRRWMERGREYSVQPEHF